MGAVRLIIIVMLNRPEGWGRGATCQVRQISQRDNARVASLAYQLMTFIG
jgi:hypothetical protein